jgi:hypothetical protein
VTEKSEMTSRRQAFSILGLAALGLSVTMVCVMPAMAGDPSDGVVGGWPKPCADGRWITPSASNPAPTCAATQPALQTGTERRQARRTERTQRRAEQR